MTDHPKIDKDELERPPIRAGRVQRPDKEIARMGVGVEKPLLKDLEEVDVHQFFGDLRTADPGALQSAKVGDLDLFHVFQREHPAGGVGAVHGRDMDAGVAGEHGLESFGVIRLGVVVQL